MTSTHQPGTAPAPAPASLRCEQLVLHTVLGGGGGPAPVHGRGICARGAVRRAQVKGDDLSAREEAQALLGKLVSVNWPKMKQSYKGELLKYLGDGKYMVLYDDDDKGEILITDPNVKFI